MNDSKYLIDYIKNNENWEKDLQSDPYNLFVRADEEYPNLRLFMYNQIKSDMTDPICQVSRGIIIDIEKLEVVCYPFSKFFNYNEPRAHSIDWSTASIQEKVDGSIMKLWNLDGKWMWSTNGTINAMNTDLPSDVGPFKSFGQVADYYIDGMETISYNSFNPNFTYIFELTSPWNRVVVPHKEARLTLLGVRENATGVETDPSTVFVDEDGFQPFFLPRLYKFNSEADMLAASEALPFDDEGYVVCDANYNRVKVKSPAYLQVHHLADNGNVSKERLLVLIRTGEDGEFLGYYPEYTDAFNEVREKWENHKAKVEEIKAHSVILNSQCETRKDYALAVQKLPKQMHSYFFALLDGREDKVNEMMEKVTYEKLFDLDSRVE